MFNRHLILPSSSPPNYYLSLSNYLVFKNGLSFFNALTWKSKIKKKLMFLAYHIFNIKNILVGQRALTSDKSGTLSSILDSLNINAINTNVYMPSYGKAIVQNLSNSGQCLKIVKIALDEESGSELKEESVKLQFLSKLLVNTFEIPYVLNEGYQESLYYAEHKCPAYYEPMEYLDYSDKMIGILAELFHCSGIAEAFVNETDFFDRIQTNKAKVTDQKTEELFSKVIHLYDDIRFRFKVPLGLVHGDFKPWNLLINKETERLFIVDWPMMSPNGFPLWDAFSYTMFTYFTLHYDVTPEKAFQVFRKHEGFYKNYCHRLNIDDFCIMNLLPLYLVDILSTGNMWSRWEKNEGRPARIADSILKFLRYIIDSNQFNKV